MHVEDSLLVPIRPVLVLKENHQVHYTLGIFSIHLFDFLDAALFGWLRKVVSPLLVLAPVNYHFIRLAQSLFGLLLNEFSVLL